MKRRSLFCFILIQICLFTQSQTKESEYADAYRVAKKAAEDNGYTILGYMKLDEFKNSKTFVQNIGPRTEVKVTFLTNSECTIVMAAWDDNTVDDPAGYTKYEEKKIGKYCRFKMLTFLTKDKAQDILFKMELKSPCSDIMNNNTSMMIHLKKY